MLQAVGWLGGEREGEERGEEELRIWGRPALRVWGGVWARKG